MSDLVRVYDRITGRKLGLRPRSWLTRFEHISETPASRSRARRSPRKKPQATPTAEPSSEATDTSPEEEKQWPDA